MSDRRLSVGIQAGILFQLFGLLIRSFASVHKASGIYLSGSDSAAAGRYVSVSLLLVFELLNIASTLFMIARFRHMESRRRDDLTLCIGTFSVSVFNVLAWHALPEIQREKNFHSLITVIMLLSGISLPPAHVLVHWIVMGTIFVYCDYMKHIDLGTRLAAAATTCNASGPSAMSEASSEFFSLGSFWSFLWTKGMRLLGTSLMAGIVGAIFSSKFESDMTASEASPKGKADDSDTVKGEDCPLPLESLGLCYDNLPPVLSFITPCLRRIKPALGQASGGISESLIASVVCLPICIFYIVRIQLSRSHQYFTLGPNSQDELFLIIVIFYMTGRESCRSDNFRLFREIQVKLQASHTLLSDLLPIHLMKKMLHVKNNEISQQDAEGNSEIQQAQITPGSSFSSRAELMAAPTDLNMEEVSLIPSLAQSNVIVDNTASFDSDMGMILSARSSARSRTTPNKDVTLFGQGDSYSSYDSVLTFAQIRHGFRSFSFKARSDSAALSRVASAPAEGLTSPPKVGGCDTSRGLLDSMAESHECVTIFFSDLAGFSTWASLLPPEKVMGTLNDLYSRLDDIILQEMPDLYKIETIGDAYIVAANLLSKDDRHAAMMVRFAIRAQEEASKVLRPDINDGSTLQMRIGIHSGPVMSGVAGKIRRRFTIFGHTVNMASRTETCCPLGCIQITQATLNLAMPHLKGIGHEVDMVERGPIQVKGSLEPIMMYLVKMKQMTECHP